VANYTTLLRETRLAFPVSPMPFHGFMPVPGQAGTPASLGADFSQVYFAAQAIRFGDAPYAPVNPAFRDRFGRRPNYPPLTNHLYVPLTLLAYRDAVVVHTVATLLLFLGATVLVLRALELGRQALGASLACLLLGFLTPVGFSHFERGQFDWVVASSFLLVVTSVYRRRAAIPSAAAGACLGALKWTAAPFLGLFSLLGVVASPTMRRRLVFYAVPTALVLAMAAFGSELRDYWPSLQLYELQASPVGVSLQRVLPRAVAKALPVASTLLFVALFVVRSRRGWDRQEAFEAVAVPFAMALALQILCAVAMAYEYRAVSLLGLLPAAVVWMDKAPGVSRPIRNGVALLLGTFFVLAFRIFDLKGHIFSANHMLLVYCAGSAMFLAVAVFILWTLPSPDRDPHPSPQPSQPPDPVGQ
jgi:hypothetical protein